MSIAGSLGDGWTLIGGQMVLLHQSERRSASVPPPLGASLRWSYDVDVIVNLRTSRSRNGHIDSVLRAHGYEQQHQSGGHRYVASNGTVIDVLAPDHLGKHPPLLGRGHTLQAAGGTQALRRSEPVEVQYNQTKAVIPRPNLIGAVLIKIAAASGPAGGRGHGRHLQDVVTLATLITPEDVATAGLTINERKRIRRAARAVRNLGDEHSHAAAAGLELLLSTVARPRSPDISTSLEAVLCGQRLGPRRWCRRKLATRPCPKHPDSPGSTKIKRRQRL